MSDRPTAHGSARYEIRLKGHLDRRWAAWFDGLTLSNCSDGTTVIHGVVVDQSALHGLLQRVRDVGLPLISVTPADPDRSDSPSTEPDPLTTPTKETTCRPPPTP